MEKQSGFTAFTKSFRGICLISAALLIGISQSVSQVKPDTKQTPVPTQAEIRASSVISLDVAEGDHLLKPGDVVDISVEKAPELSGSHVLNDKGTFVFPVLGVIKAENQTAEGLSQMIADRLRGSYLTNPLVSVSIKQIKNKSKIYFIQGAVRNPGTFQIDGRPSLLKLITIAGGLADNYGSTAFVIREKKGSDHLVTAAGKSSDTMEKKSSTAPNNEAAATGFDEDQYELVKVNIANLLRGNFEQNIPIQSGDIVHIPKSDIFFVAGEVVAPGTFPLREGTTLRQAVSLAQGTKYEGATDRGIIFRDENGASVRDGCFPRRRCRRGGGFRRAHREENEER